MPDKTSKDRPKTLKFEWYSRLFGCRTCANCHFLVNKSHEKDTIPGYRIYAYCIRRYQTGFIVEINRCAPKPLHSHDALLLGHIKNPTPATLRGRVYCDVPVCMCLTCLSMNKISQKVRDNSLLDSRLIIKKMSFCSLSLDLKTSFPWRWQRDARRKFGNNFCFQIKTQWVERRFFSLKKYCTNELYILHGN